MTTWPVPNWDVGDHGDPTTLNARVTDPLNDLSDHAHSGAGGDGAADLTPTSVTLGAGMLEESKGTAISTITSNNITLPSDGNYFLLSAGAGTIAVINGTVQDGTRILIRCQNAQTWTHSSPTLVLQGGVDWAAPAGSMIEFVRDGGWREVGRWALGNPTITGPLTLQAVAADTSLIATATSSTPSTTWTAGVPDSDPAGFIKLKVGGSDRFLPYWT